MRFLGLVITLAVIGYAVHIYLGSSSSVDTQPEQQIDQAKQAADVMNQALQRQQDKFNSAN